MRKILLVTLLSIFSISMLIASGQNATLPACNDSDLQYVNDVAIFAYQGLIDTAREIATTDDLLAYVESELEWRDGILSQFPDCAEAIELGNVMSQTLSDLSTLYALDLAGVDRDDNPIEARVSANLTRFTELADIEEPILEEPTAIPVQTKTYYVNANGAVNIRSCDSTNCGVVATANRGDALTVVDDTSDWYELQLDDGSTGYIAEFLVSANRPSTQPTAVPVQPTTVPQQNIQPTAVPVQPTTVPVQPTQAPVSTVAVQSEAPAQPQFTCGADIYNCGDFSVCNEVMAYFNACPGDPSRLDRDNDGVPCESLCGG